MQGLGSLVTRLRLLGEQEPQLRLPLLRLDSPLAEDRQLALHPPNQALSLCSWFPSVLAASATERLASTCRARPAAAAALPQAAAAAGSRSSGPAAAAPLPHPGADLVPPAAACSTPAPAGAG